MPIYTKERAHVPQFNSAHKVYRFLFFLSRLYNSQRRFEIKTKFIRPFFLLLCNTLVLLLLLLLVIWFILKCFWFWIISFSTCNRNSFRFWWFNAFYCRHLLCVKWINNVFEQKNRIGTSSTQYTYLLFKVFKKRSIGLFF